MHCKICDSMLTDIQWNSQHEEWEPCGTCLFVINETIGKHLDKPFADEEDLVDDALDELDRWVSDAGHWDAANDA